MTEVRIKVYNWKARDNYSAIWHRSAQTSYIKTHVVYIHR